MERNRNDRAILVWSATGLPGSWLTRLPMEKSAADFGLAAELHADGRFGKKPSPGIGI